MKSDFEIKERDRKKRVAIAHKEDKQMLYIATIQFTYTLYSTKLR